VATAAAIAAGATWQSDLEGKLVLSVAGSVAPTAHAVDGVNTIRWALAVDDPDLERGLLARTFLAYDVATGALRDADIVLDAHDFAWRTIGACSNEYDLQSALTHEYGHALGLGHALGHPDATMFATGDACETKKRDLDPDDRAGLASLYPDDPVSTGCASSTTTPPTGGLLAILAIVALGLRRRRTGCALALAAVVTVVPTPARAAQLSKLSIDELAGEAVAVVRGRVTTTTTVRDPYLVTDATIAVDECLAGTCGKTLVVRRIGGELGGEGLLVDGEASLTTGVEVVVFVRLDRHRHARVLGGVQGVLTVERTADGRASAIRDLRSHHVRAGAGWRDGDRERFDLDAIRAAASKPTTR
jgi:MYXO-CTERM domain-containing protein